MALNSLTLHKPVSVLSCGPNAKGERVLMWGDCRNILGHPVNLCTVHTVGRHYVLSVHCVKFVPVSVSLLL